MLLLGERLSAEEAREAGIVNKVVPAEEFDAAVADWAAQARRQVAGADEARQGRDVPPDGHAASTTRSTTCAHSCRSPSPPRTSRRACGRSSRSGSPSGKAGDAGRRWWPCAAGPPTARRARVRGVEALAPLVAARLGRERAADRQPAATRSRAATRTTCATRAAACSRPAARWTTRSRAATCRCCWRASARSALTTLPTALRHRPEAKVLWLDAHGDFNTPDTTPSGYLGGMALAGACGQWDAGLGGHDLAGPGGARRRARPRPGRAELLERAR